MTTISLAELYSNPAGQMQRVAAGETLLILDGERLVAEIRPPNDNRRPSGLAAGQFVVPDDFDAPLPEQILRDFNLQ